MDEYEYCHGSGVVTQGEPGDEHDVTCVCQTDDTDMSGASDGLSEDGNDR